MFPLLQVAPLESHRWQVRERQVVPAQQSPAKVHACPCAAHVVEPWHCWVVASHRSEQHAAPLAQKEPGAPHVVAWQLPVVHTPEQHSELTAQPLVSGRQPGSPHNPLAHWSEQHDALRVHASPRPRHNGPVVHTLPRHFSPQHCVLLEHA